MTASSVDILPRSRGHRVHFQSITTARDLISGIFRVSINMRLMTAAWLCRTLFRVLQKTVRVPELTDKNHSTSFVQSRESQK